MVTSIHRAGALRELRVAGCTPLGHDATVTVLPRSRLSSAVDRLYRWRWWTLAVLLPVGLVTIDDGPAKDPWDWAVFSLFAVLLWLPVLVRWLRAGRDAILAFRSELDVGETGRDGGRRAAGGRRRPG